MRRVIAAGAACPRPGGLPRPSRRPAIRSYSSGELIVMPVSASRSGTCQAASQPKTPVPAPAWRRGRRRAVSKNQAVTWPPQAAATARQRFACQCRAAAASPASLRAPVEREPHLPGGGGSARLASAAGRLHGGVSAGLTSLRPGVDRGHCCHLSLLRVLWCGPVLIRASAVAPGSLVVPGLGNRFQAASPQGGPGPAPLRRRAAAGPGQPWPHPGSGSVRQG